jgi:zona occludens toxin (predicted ATPase)
MTELLFTLTIAFSGYVLYEVFKTVSDTHESPAQETVSAPAAVVAVASPPAKEPVAPVAALKAEPTPVTVAASAVEPRGPSLRDPASGEIAPIPTNYRFAKKWIKEALVTEGLLPKVYKNSELKGDTNGQVKDALEKFKGLEKYLV